MFETGNFFRDYKKDTFYRFDLMPKANWERLQLETSRNVIQDLEAQTDKNHKCALIFALKIVYKRPNAHHLKMIIPTTATAMPMTFRPSSGCRSTPNRPISSIA